MKRAAIGLRVSSEKQADEGYSIQSQLRRNMEYAQSLELHVPDEYVFTEVFTGTTSDRPGLNQIKELAQAHRIDALVVYNADRFFRNRIEAYLTRKFLQKHNVELYYAEKFRKVGTGLDDEILNGIEELLAEVEKERIKERTMRGRWERAKLGIVPGQGKPPYGYRRTMQLRDKKRIYAMEIVIEQANIIRLIYTWYVIDRWSVFKIRDELTRLRIPAPGDLVTTSNRRRAYGEWHARPIYRILEHSAYVGRLIVRQYQDIRGEKRTKVLRPESEWIAIDIPPIIEETVWHQAQIRMRAGRQLSPRSKEPSRAYLFARRIRCECGASMRISTNRTHNRVEYYRCLSGSNVSGRCVMPTIQRAVVDEPLWLHIVALLLRPKSLLEKAVEHERKMDGYAQTLHDQFALIEEQIGKAKQRREAILESIIDTRIQQMHASQKSEIIASLNARIIDIETSIEGLQEERNRISNRIASERDTQSKIGMIESYGQLFALALESQTLDYTFKRGVIDDLDIRVTITQTDGNLFGILDIFGLRFTIPLH